jgi:hypothetical protein
LGQVIEWVSAAEAKSPGEIDHDEIGFRFGSGDSMGSLVANDFCPVSRVGARGRASAFGAMSFGRPRFAQERAISGAGIRTRPAIFDGADFPFRDQFIDCRATDTDCLRKIVDPVCLRGSRFRILLLSKSAAALRHT